MSRTPRGLRDAAVRANRAQGVDKLLCSAAAIVALALAGPATPVRAQQVGDRVRVSLPDSTAIGDVTAVSDAGFEIVRDSTLFPFSYGSIEGLERSNGRKRLMLEGVLVGAAIPLRLGFGLIASCWEMAAGDSAAGAFIFAFLCFIPGATIAIVGTPIGAVVGGIAGFFVHREEWTAVPLDDRAGGPSLLLPRFGPDGQVGLNLGIRIPIP